MKRLKSNALNIITLILVALKLTGLISWSWWLVALPSLFIYLIVLITLSAHLVIELVKRIMK
jgi:hypothetical protein